MNGRMPTPDPRASAAPKPADPASGGNFLAELRSGDVAPEVVAPLQKPRRRIKIQNVMVVAVIVFSIVAIFLMRQIGTKRGRNFETVKIDYQLDGAGSRLTPEQKKILADLAATSEPIQIAPSEIDKNPFTLEETRVMSFIGDPAPTRPRDPDADAQVQIAQVLSKLELNGTMRGRIPIARISGRIYKVGDLIEGTFILKSVDDRTVELEAGGKTWALSIGEPDNTNR